MREIHPVCNIDAEKGPWPDESGRHDHTVVVSIITTVFNGEAFLAEAIASVLAQTYPYWELIIVDDGSSDRSRAIATQSAQQDPRIQFYRIEHAGRIGALQYAHSRTTGALLAYLDADDKLHPEAVAKTAAYLEQTPTCGMVYTNNVAINESGKVLGEGPHNKLPYSPDALLRNFMTFHFRLMRASIFEAIGGINPYSGRAEDYDLCLRFSEITRIAHIPESLYYYRIHGNQISQADRRQQQQDSVKVIRNALIRRRLAAKIKVELDLKTSKIKLSKRHP